MACVCHGMCVCVGDAAGCARISCSCSLALLLSCSSSLTLVPEPFLCLCVRSLSNDLFDGERASQSLRARLECGSTAVSSRVLSLSGPLGLTDGTATLPWILEVPPPPPYTPYPKERANTYRDLTDAQTSDRIPIDLRPITSDRIPIDLRPQTSYRIPMHLRSCLRVGVYAYAVAARVHVCMNACLYSGSLCIRPLFLAYSASLSLSLSPCHRRFLNFRGCM